MPGDVTYTDEEKEKLFLELMERVSEGGALTSLCNKPGFPRRSTIYLWMAEDPEKRKLYELAHDLRAEYLLEESLKIVDSVKTESMVDVVKAKLRAEQRRFMLPKISRKYQDKNDINFKGNLSLTHKKHKPIDEMTEDERDEELRTLIEGGNE